MTRKRRTTALVWEVMCAHVGQEVEVADIVQYTDLTDKQVRDALWVIGSRLGHPLQKVRERVYILHSAGSGELGRQTGLRGGTPPARLFEKVAFGAGSVMLRDMDGHLYEARKVSDGADVPITDLDRYKDLLARSGQAFEESGDGATMVVSGKPDAERAAMGSYYAVYAMFDADGNLKTLSPDGCRFDCGHCRT